MKQFLSTFFACLLAVSVVAAFVYWRVWVWWNSPLDKQAITALNYNILWIGCIVIAAVEGGMAVWGIWRLKE